MKKELETVVKDIEKNFKATRGEFREQARLVVQPEQIVEVCQRLRDEHAFEMLPSITAVDYWPQSTPRFHVVYQFNSLSKQLRLEVRVPLDGNSPELDSVTSVYPNAGWLERELWDMFGLRVQNHPDLRRILMPYEWEGHPLRKDYPLGYEEVQFTFNFEEIQARKPKPPRYPDEGWEV
ncbi:MAG: NADH-quinone oxidoreductase subunit C [Anaerolineales bacterium]|nr:NADH-quinone oxidoreductase subunit C [Anaerolineales bacterium]